eukprot:scaffold29071_cov39-Prasinocladus_malaysianus.AAC.1
MLSLLLTKDDEQNAYPCHEFLTDRIYQIAHLKVCNQTVRQQRESVGIIQAAISGHAAVMLFGILSLAGFQHPFHVLEGRCERVGPEQLLADQINLLKVVRRGPSGHDVILSTQMHGLRLNFSRQAAFTECQVPRAMYQSPDLALLKR